MKQTDVPFIFIRGLARSQVHWGPFLNEITSIASDYECLDLAGNGTEGNRASFDRIPEYVTDLRSRSRLINKGLKPVVVGISMGGMVATQWAIEYPDDLSGVVLINTSFGKLSAPWERLLPKAYFYLLKILVAEEEDQPFERELQILRMVSNLPLDQKKHWAKQFAKYPITSLQNMFRQLLASSRYQGTLNPPQLPKLILYSNHDRMVHPSCSEKIRLFWNSPFAIHPWAGHDLPLDDPVWVTTQLKRFLNGGEFLLPN